VNIEDRITLAKELIRKRDEIDQQLAELFGGGTPKKAKCSICGSTEHTARTCPQKPGTERKLEPPSAPAPSAFDVLSSHPAIDSTNADL